MNIHLLRDMRIIRVLLIFCFACLVTKLDAQVFLQKYDSITDKNISSFMNDWKEWSMSVADTLQEDEYNRIIKEYFTSKLKSQKKNRRSIFWSKKTFRRVWYRLTHFYRKKGIQYHKYCHPAYIVLPYQVNIRTYNACRDSVEACSNFRNKYLQGVSTYTPLLKDKQNVLYLNNSIVEMVTQYLGGYWKDATRKEIVKIDKKRLSKIRKYIPAAYGHWGGYWWFVTMPYVIDIKRYPECLEISYRTSWCSGETIRYENSQIVESSPKGEILNRWME